MKSCGDLGHSETGSGETVGQVHRISNLQSPSNISDPWAGSLHHHSESDNWRSRASVIDS